MQRHETNCWLTALGRRWALAVAALGLASAVPAAPAAAATPGLVVVVSVDQFSANLLDQHRSRFRFGLKRLIETGVFFPNGYQSHGLTETCPGHSTILTGRHPSATRIVGNDWFDPKTGRKIYCAEDTRKVVIGRPTQPRGPGNLAVPVLGDWLQARDGRSRTVAVAGKDRAAIMLSGAHPDAVFWWDDENGFNTYGDSAADASRRLAPVARFNQELSRRWQAEPPQWQPADPACAALDGPHRYGPRLTDHRVHRQPPTKLTGEALRRDKTFIKWLRASPVVDRLTLSLADQLVDDLALGRRGTTDLLAIGLSATDAIGHAYGNQGPEMCDQLAHLDRQLGRFLDGLDARRLDYLVVLTADHGSLDAAERVAERAIPARRIAPPSVAQLNSELRRELSLAHDPLAGDDRGLTYVGFEDRRAEIRAAVLRALARRPDIRVFEKTQLQGRSPDAATPADELTLEARLVRSLDIERSHDLLFLYPPYASIGIPGVSSDNIAGHGSPWNYDRRVPIVFYWKGARAFEQPLPIQTVDIAPTLAAILQLPAPATDGRCRDLDISERDSCKGGLTSANRPPQQPEGRTR